jgi:hypothetical protein
MKLRAIPVTLEEANAFIASHHRHNLPVLGARFGIGVSDGTNLVGVATCGRPVARLLQDGGTAEVTRCCVLEDAPKGTCSFLYAACWRAWKAMGGTRLVTYTLQSESGSSLRGAGAKVIAELAPNRPAMWTNRPGREFQPVVGQAKFRWEWAA